MCDVDMEKKTSWRVVKTAEEEFVVPWNKEAKVKYYLDQAKFAEERGDIYGCKSWLITGVSIVPESFELHYELYLFEKRRQNISEIAWHFESMYRKFPEGMDSEITAMADAVRNSHMTRAKETEEQIFLNKIFDALSKNFQMEVLLSRTEKTVVHYEKCQIMLLLVKLFPDTVNQHGAELLFTVLGYDSDVFSIFRKLLVTELIPAVLQVRKEWNSSATPQVYQILNQCIEYYVLVPDQEAGSESDGSDRWTKLFKIVDHIGSLLHWKLSPFFNEYSGPSSIEGLFQKLSAAVNDRKDYAPNELAYIAVVFFLQCITSYNRIRYGSKSGKHEDKKLGMILVEVFTPNPLGAIVDSNLPVLLTGSHSSSVQINQTHLIHFFLTATKIWQIFNSLKGQEEKDFFTILYSMKSLDLDNWDVFQNFSADFRTYVGQYFPESSGVQNSIQLASFHCAVGNFKAAAEFALKAVSTLSIDERKNNESMSVGTSSMEDLSLHSGSNRDDLSFFNSHLYSLDRQGNFIPQRRVHFLSDDPWEVVMYASNVLIRCLFELLDREDIAPDDLCMGHLMTLIQLEWPSPPAEKIFLRILEIIREKGSFHYAQYFGDFIFEPDFLEQFMSIANHESKTALLDIWPNTNGSTTGLSRRMATRGVDKGAKNEFRVAMKKQMMKNVQPLEKLILKFMTLNKFELLQCFAFDLPISYKKHV